MDLTKSVITTQLFNQRIGYCLQVIVITWLLWRPIHCNTNGLNEGNRRTKSSEQRLNQNGFDPSSHTTSTAYNRSVNSLYLDHYNLNYNYLLSVLQNDERQAILNNVIHHKSDPTPPLVEDIHQNVDSMPDNRIDLGEVEDRSNLQDTNKLFSPSLNVMDVSPHNLQLAHSVLLIHKPKPNKTSVKPTFAPQLLFPQTITGTGVKSPVVVTAMKTPTSTEAYSFVRNNHRPMFLRPFPGKKTTTTTTPPSTLAIKTSSFSTTILSSSAKTTQTATNTTTTASQASDDLPIIISSNHKHKQQSIPMFTRQKLTSTEYALVFTTPDSIPESDKPIFTEVPTTLSTMTSTPSFTYKPPYMTTVSHQKRPPIRIMTVNANRIRPPEEIYSEGITVLDPPFISGHPHKLPPNTTVIHKNLIVPMKDGRPKPVFPMTSTTQFPVYPMVAGITKWHTAATTPWSFPIVTTTSPEFMLTSTLGSETTETTDSLSPMTSQSVNRPVVISGHPLLSSPATSEQTSNLVTVTPIKTSSHSPTASTFLVSHSSPRPSTSTQGYVNAIWAPPMPVSPGGRPVQAIQSTVGAPGGSWFSPISNIFSIDPASSSLMSFMGIFRTFLMAFLFFVVSPWTLLAAMIQYFAVG